MNSIYMELNPEIELAYDWINTTNAPIFLCGKAGTGKTLFLKHLSDKTYKKLIILAPTGIAASNAGGATLHSQFNLPLTCILPQDTGILDEILFTNSRRKTLQALELLVIDEISMLRADLLDAVDYLLKKIRGNTLTFGGVQILLIGDPFQLPPVVTDNDWKKLNTVYSSPYFFEAFCLKNTKPVLIILNKVYRQKDHDFVEILNAVRNNQLDNGMLQRLNDRCLIDDNIPTDYILLTTHNEKAQRHNQLILATAEGELKKFPAIIEGNFDLSQCLAEPLLELKTGVPVILIKNHKEQPAKYFNGRMGIVNRIGLNEIEVNFSDGDKITLERDIWLETEYTYEKNNNVFQKLVKGSLQQFPLKLGAAITIHKSQGLTFERAVLDLTDVFAPGQLYVALSRLTSLEGLLLLTPLSRHLITFNPALENFSSRFSDSAKDNFFLEMARYDFIYSLIIRSLSWQPILASIYPAQFNQDQSLTSFYHLIQSFNQTSNIFIPYITQAMNKKNLPEIYERVSKAIIYFLEQMENEIIKPLKNFIQQNRNSIHGKRYITAATSMKSLLTKKTNELLTMDKFIKLIIGGNSTTAAFKICMIR